MAAIHTADQELLHKLLLGQLSTADVERLATEYADDARLAELAESLAGKDDALLALLKNHETAVIDPEGERLVERLLERLKPSLPVKPRDDTAAMNKADATTEPSSPNVMGMPQKLPERLEYYRPIKVLGQGGMGTVYLAEDTRLGREVAIKTLRPELAINPQAKERFLREARTAAKLEHDNVIPIYSVGEADGTPFLAMPLLKGEPLDALIRRMAGPLPVATVVRIAREAASGLAAAHARGLIHRDIKPANIWLEAPTDRVKILDFGLAKAADASGDADSETHLTASGAIVGTPAYMAPEQASGHPVDGRADLFSLGCVMYELLSGKRAFSGPNTMSILMSLANHTPPAPDKLSPQCPAALSRLVMQLLEKDPAKRPVSAEAVIEALAGLDIESTQMSRAALAIGSSQDATAVRGLTPSGSPTELIHPSDSVLTLPATAVLPARKRAIPKQRVALALAGVLLMLLAAVVYRIQTDQGTLVVTIDDPGVQAILEQDGLLIRDKSNDRTWTIKTTEKKPLPSGRYQVEGKPSLQLLVTDDNGAEVKTDEFTLKRKGERRVRVVLEQTSNVAENKQAVVAKWSRADGSPLTASQLVGPQPPPAVAPFDAKQARAHQEAWAKHLGTTVETTNSVGAKMVLIPPGEFLMGSTDEQVEAASKAVDEAKAARWIKDVIQKNERPQHKVVITKPLRMSATEVTVGQFKKFAAATGYQTEGEKAAKDAKTKAGTYLVLTSDELPAAYVTWNDAAAYCQWLSTQEKTTYRLPTEAEWEYACRAGTTTLHSFGDDMALLDQYGWYTKNFGSGPHSVGTRLPNNFGLFDMHGNLSEWCSDYYSEKGYEKTPLNDPHGPSDGSTRVMRGGYWGSIASQCCSAHRHNSMPSFRHHAHGFRVVRTLDAPATTFTANRFSLDMDVTLDKGTARVELPAVLSADSPCTVEMYLTPRSVAQISSPLFFLEQGVHLKQHGRKWHWGAANDDEVISPDVISVDRRFHLAGISTGKELWLFVDGKLAGKSPLRNQPPAKAGICLLGGTFLTFENWKPFNGTIDAFRMSNTARYDRDFIPPTRFEPDRNTLALYHFTEGEGETLADVSGRGHHGRIIGAKWVKTDGSITHATPSNSSTPPLAQAPFDAQRARAHQEAWAKHLGTTVETTNSVGAKMVLIPPGEFLMGSTDEHVEAALKDAEKIKTDQAWKDHLQTTERPQHRVIITKPFLLGATEVTVGQFKKFVAATGYQTDVEKAAKDPQPPPYLKPGYDVTDDSPAAAITWNDAVAYCKWLSDQEKTTYRLPTEAEWEYACRAGTTTRYSFGDDVALLHQFGWQDGRHSHAVGTKLPNGFGLFDMHGNVREWCGDFYVEHVYEAAPQIDPTGPAAPSNRGGRVMRGGSFALFWCHTAYRSGDSATNRRNMNGFRIVRVLDAPATMASVTPQSLATNPDRRAAEWVLSIGGTPVIKENGTGRKIGAVGDLPGGAFEIAVFELWGSQKVSDAGLAHFDGCKKLTNLNIGGTQVTDAGLAYFKQCKNLTTLQLNMSAVSDAGLAHFKDCKDLEHLDLGNLRVSNAGLVNFKDCKNLAVLLLGGTDVSDAELVYFKDRKNLYRIELQSTKVSDAGLTDLASLPRPSSSFLDLRDTRISLRGYEQLKAAQPKSKITWSETNRSVAESVLALGGAVEIGSLGKPESRSIKAVSDLPGDYFQVRRVSLDGVTKPLDKLPQQMSRLSFPDFDRLESIDLSSIKGLDYRFLVPIHGLRELSLANSGLNDESLAKLPKLPALQRLVLDGNQIHGRELASLKQQPELIDLSLSGPSLGDLFAKNLTELKPLKRLSLAGSGLTDAGIKHFASLTNLETLDLRRTKATAAGISELKAALPQCKIEWDGGVIEPGQSEKPK